MRSRYWRWDGTQDPLGERIDVGDLLDQLGDDMLSGAGGRTSLARLRDQGWQGQTGLAELRDRVRRMRQDLTDSMDLDGPFREIQEQLDAILDARTPRAGGRDDPDARFAEAMLDALPRDPAGRLRELQQHDFASDEAQQRFDELVESIRRDVLDAYLRDLAGAVDQMGPEQVAADGRRCSPTSTPCSRPGRGARNRTSTPSWTVTATCSRNSPRTSTSCSRCWPAGRWPCSRCSRPCRPSSAARWPSWRAASSTTPTCALQLSQLQGNLAEAMAGMDLSQLGPPQEGGDPTGPFSADGRRDGAAGRAGRARAVARRRVRRRHPGRRRRGGPAPIPRPGRGPRRPAPAPDRARAGAGRRPAGAGRRAGDDTAGRAAAGGEGADGPARPGPPATRRPPPRRRPRTDRPDPPVALRRHRAAGGPAHAVQRRHEARRRRGWTRPSPSGWCPTTSRSSSRRCAPPPPRRCCSTCRSRCRCRATSCRPSAWPWRCTP